MRRLADFPGIGRARSDLSDETLRVWAVYSYLIIYRPDTKPLQVLRVIHGARELKRIPLE
jgi:antitoxin ParD1/3/4/toxin ParE1/3/4